ncbi:kinase-like protein [Suillus decipiens]|nr:kinase-like protein [Suillus decipiens]
MISAPRRNASEISTTASSSTGMLATDIHDSVHILNKEFVSITSWVAHDLGMTDKRNPAPVLLRPSKVQPSNDKPHLVSCFALSFMLSFIAIGLAGGTVLLYRHLGQSLSSASFLTTLPKTRTILSRRILMKATSLIHTHLNYVIVVSLLTTVATTSPATRKLAAQAAGGDGDASRATVFDMEHMVVGYTGMFVEGIKKWAEIHLCKTLRVACKGSISACIKSSQTQCLDESYVADIHRQYGDYLDTKGDWGGAMTCYVEAIGWVKPSYVVRKFLDAQRNTILSPIYKSCIPLTSQTLIIPLFCLMPTPNSKTLHAWIVSLSHTRGLAILWLYSGRNWQCMRAFSVWMDKHNRSPSESSASAEAVQALVRYGLTHLHLYEPELRFLTGTLEVLTRHQADVGKILEHIEKERTIPLGGVVQILYKNGVVRVGLVKDWLMGHIKKPREDDQQPINSYRLRTNAKLKQVAELEDPMHAKDHETECPLCVRQHGVIQEIRRNDERMSDQHELFLANVQDNGFKVVAFMWWKVGISVDFIQSMPVAVALAMCPLRFLLPEAIGGSTLRYTSAYLVANMLTVKTIARRVSTYFHRPSASDVPGISDDERSSSLTSSDDGQSGRYSSSEEEHSQLVSLIQITTAQTSTYGSFIIDTSIATRQPIFPTASGGLGDVYKCILNRDASSEEVAVKSPRFPSLTDADVAKINHNLDREIKVWTRLNHRYVLRLHGTVTGFGPFRALVSPWMPNGTLNSYLDRAHETLTTMDKLIILKQITEGLKYLHDNDVIHGDLTSNNVLVAADKSPRLADFGVSNIMVDSNPAFSYQTGAVRWVAPELVVLEEDQTAQCATKYSDIYALGCIMLQVLYGKLPYWWLQTALRVMGSKFKYQEPINDSIQIQENHLDFMRWCWSIEIENRPSAEVVLAFLEKAISIEASS